MPSVTYCPCLATNHLILHPYLQLQLTKKQSRLLWSPCSCDPSKAIHIQLRPVSPWSSAAANAWPLSRCLASYRCSSITSSHPYSRELLAASTSSSTSSCSSRPPLRSIAGSAFIRPTARSIGLQSQGPGQAGRLVQTSSSTQATPDPGSRTDLGAVACASKPTEIFSSPCADIHHKQQKEQR